MFWVFFYTGFFFSVFSKPKCFWLIQNDDCNLVGALIAMHDLFMKMKYFKPYIPS